MDAVDQRVQRLEREFQRSRRINRILIGALVVVGGVAGAWVPDQATPPVPQQSQSSDDPPERIEPRRGAERLRTVEADEFVLLDREGRSRAKMMVTDGGPELCMFDEDGQKRLELRQTQIGSGLRLFDANEVPVVALQLPQAANRAHLEIKSPQGSSLTRASGYSVRDAAEHGRLHLSLLNGNYATLGISQEGQAGPSTIEMTATEGSRSLTLHNDQGNLLFSLFAADDGKTTLNMRHPEHERSLQISTGATDQDGPGIAFFAPANEDGSGGLLPFLQLGFDPGRRPFVRIVDRDGRPQFTAPTK